MEQHGNMTTAEYIAELFEFTERDIWFSTLPNERDLPGEPGERHILTREVEAVERFVAKWDRRNRGLYYCVSTIKDRRAKANALELPAAHSDIDFRGSASPEDEIHRILDTKLRLLPTRVVHSGRGLHPYWQFKEPLDLTEPGMVERAEAVLRLLADHLGGDLAVCEVARLMRLPGTHNSKDGERRPCRVVLNTDRRYTLDDLEEWLTETAPVLHRKTVSHSDTGVGLNTPISTTPPDNPFLAKAMAMGFKPPVDVEQRLAAMVYGDPGENGIHATQLSVSASLLSAGRSAQEVVELLLEITRKAAGEMGLRWNWQRERIALEKMCATWTAKHPPQVRAEIHAQALPAAGPADAISGAGGSGTTATVTDLSQARAKRKAKAPAGDVPKHIVLGEAVLAAIEARGERLLFTDNSAHRYVDGLWSLWVMRDLEPWLDRLIEEAFAALSISGTARLVNETRKFIVRQPRLHQGAPAWDRHGQVPTLTGLVNPRTGALTPAAPEHYATWRVPFAYDPAAACPRWLEMLADTFGDRNAMSRALHMQFVQELLGMGLTDTKPKTLSLAAVFQGVSDTGKSGLLNVMSGLFGEREISAPIDTLEHAHALMPFMQRAPWVLHEAFNASQWHLSSTVKAIISGDGVQVNIKGGPLLTRRITAPLFWGTNNPAQFKEATKAVTNRLAVIKCLRTFQRGTPVGVAAIARETGYESPQALVLATEMPGVLAWAVEGLKRALARGHFEIPPESLAAGEEILAEANLVAGLVRDCIEFDDRSRLSIADCWAAFSMWWLRNRGEDRAPPSRNAMGRAFRALGDDRIGIDNRELRDEDRRYYVGIRLSPEGIKLWRDAVQSDAFALRGRLGDATPTDATPYSEIPASWFTKETVQNMRRAHDVAQRQGSDRSGNLPPDDGRVNVGSETGQVPQPVVRSREPRF